MNTHLVNEIRERRERLRLSQRDFADLVGCSQAWVTRIESGDVPTSNQYVRRAGAVLWKLAEDHAL